MISASGWLFKRNAKMKYNSAEFMLHTILQLCKTYINYVHAQAIRSEQFAVPRTKRN